MTPFDLGYEDGYHDKLPDSPFSPGSEEDLEYQRGWSEGNRNH